MVATLQQWKQAIKKYTQGAHHAGYTSKQLSNYQSQRATGKSHTAAQQSALNSASASALGLAKNITNVSQSLISSGSSSGSKSYTTSSGSSSGGGGTTTKTTKKTETYYERTTTTQDTVETTTITYKITKDGKTTLDDGSTIKDIHLFDNTPDNKFLPKTNGIGLDDLFSKCQWDTKNAQEKGAALTKNYTKEEFATAIQTTTTPTNGSDQTGNNIGVNGKDIGRVTLNQNDFSYNFGSYQDTYTYDVESGTYITNDTNTQRNPSISYSTNDNTATVTIKYYEDIIRAETNSEWLSRVKKNERPSFAQIYKKLNDDEIINSISISTTNKFRDYMSQVWGTVNEDGSVTPLDLDAEAKNGDAKHVLTLFIDNITLHEAKHIPLFYPNVRMKFYHSSDRPDDIDTYNLRKIGAVIEYR